MSSGKSKYLPYSSHITFKAGSVVVELREREEESAVPSSPLLSFPSSPIAPPPVVPLLLLLFVSGVGC